MSLITYIRGSGVIAVKHCTFSSSHWQPAYPILTQELVRLGKLLIHTRLTMSLGIASIFGLAQTYSTTTGVINNLTSKYAAFHSSLKKFIDNNQQLEHLPARFGYSMNELTQTG